MTPCTLALALASNASAPPPDNASAGGPFARAGARTGALHLAHAGTGTDARRHLAKFCGPSDRGQTWV
jgi:hypothetical protein